MRGYVPRPRPQPHSRKNQKRGSIPTNRIVLLCRSDEDSPHIPTSSEAGSRGGRDGVKDGTGGGAGQKSRRTSSETTTPTSLPRKKVLKNFRQNSDGIGLLCSPDGDSSLVLMEIRGGRSGPGEGWVESQVGWFRRPRPQPRSHENQIPSEKKTRIGS